MGASRLSNLLAAGALSASLHATGAAEQPKPKASASATVTVTAEASPVELAKTPNPVKVITAEEIQRSGARDLSELLQRELPGQVSQTGGLGTIAAPQLGGTRPQDTVVLLDGIRLVDATGIGVDLSTISLAGVARVEIQRGPASTLYGSDAQGGVIALYTDAAVERGAHGDWTLGLGTHGLGRLNGADSLGWDGGNARVALSGGRQDAPTEADNRFREGSAFLGLTQAVAEDHSLSVIYRAAFQGVPLPYKSVDLAPGPRPATDYEAARQDSVRSQQAISTLRSAWGADWATELTLGYAEQTRTEPNDFGSAPPVYRSNSYASQDNLALHWTPSAAWSGTFLLQGVHERAVMPDYAGGLSRGEGRHLAAAVEAAWEPTDALRVTGSLRHQKDHQDFIVTSGPSAPDTSNGSTTGKLGLNWQLGSGFRVYASGGSAFSNPLLYQVMYNANSGGANLDNEKSHFIQIGAGFDQGPWHGRLEAWRTQMGAAVNFNYNTFLYEMGRDLRFQGLEAALGWRQEGTALEGWARSQEARDQTLPADQQLMGLTVIRRPFFAFGLKGEQAWGDVRGALAWSWQGPSYDYFGGFPAVVGPGRVHYNDLSASLAWTIREGMSLTLRGENLLQPRITKSGWLARATDFQNDAYQVYNFPPQPPTVSVEFRIRY